VGSNQYRTRPGTALPVGGADDLMQQAAGGGAPAVERRRCGEVWGTACQAWVRGPGWSHGKHPADPATLAGIVDPDRTIHTVGIEQLSEDQLFHLLCNPRVQPQTILELLRHPHSRQILERNYMLFGTGIHSWSAQQIRTIIDQWPADLPTGHYSAVSSLVLEGLNVHDLWQLESDPRWGEQAVAHLQSRRIDDPGLLRFVWRYTKANDTDKDLNRVIENNWDKLPPDILHEALASGILDYFNVYNLIRSHHQLLSDQELQQAALAHPNQGMVVSAVLDAIAQRPVGQDLRWLWEASDRLRSFQVYRWLQGGLPATRAVLLRPELPPEAHLHYISMAVSQAKSVYEARQAFSGEPAIPATAIEAAYADPDVRSRMTIDVREQLVGLPQCPPHVVAQEARSSSERVALAAVRNPQCPGDLVLRALRSAEGPVRQMLLEHPNLPEEYRALARL
jgi:hypothetical protein